MAVPAFQLPKVEGVTQVLAYLPPTLGRKNGTYAVWFPKVGGTITRKPFFGSRWGRKMASTRYGSPRSGGWGIQTVSSLRSLRSSIRSAISDSVRSLSRIKVFRRDLADPPKRLSFMCLRTHRLYSGFSTSG